MTSSDGEDSRTRPLTDGATADAIFHVAKAGPFGNVNLVIAGEMAEGPDVRMSLRIVCQRCHAALVLHDAFAGATCRCNRCGCAMDVPAPTRPTTRVQVRPSRPPLISEASTIRTQAPRVASGVALAAAVGATGVAAAVAKPKLVTLAAILTKWWLAVGAGAAVTVAAVGTTVVVRHRASPNAAAPATLVADFDVVDTLEETRIAYWPAPSRAIRTYLSQDMGDASIAWVIDTSKEVAPYYSTLARLTSIAAMNLQPGAQRFGVVLATADGPQVRHIELASKEAYRRAKSLIEGAAPTGAADLGLAFSAAARQRPDKIIFVIGQKIDLDAVAEMRRQAKAVGTIVNVIALGEDQPPLRRLARATGGDYKFVDAHSLETWATLIAQNGTLPKLEKEFLSR